eukprot:m.151401 g.151401  ORF g.151401 m.151401 type:complete len:105 (+) comp15039_c0_seq6:824-1138(+)
MGPAMELVLTGRVFRAKDAPHGLFQHLEDGEESVLKKAQDLACEIAGNTSGMSVALSRLMLIRNQVMTPEQAHLIESKALFHMSQSEDAVSLYEKLYSLLCIIA